MRPRPASRKRPLQVVQPETLAAEVRKLRDAGEDPPAVIAGPREWRALAQQPGAREFVEHWPGDDVTFLRVAVLVRVGYGAPRVMANQQELEDVLLGKED